MSPCFWEPVLSITHIFFFYHGEIFLFIQEARGVRNATARLFRLPSRVCLWQRSGMKGRCCLLLWPFSRIPVPRTVLPKLQIHPDQTETPNSVRAGTVQPSHSNSLGTVAWGWIQTNSKSCVLPSSLSSVPSHLVTNPREGPVETLSIQSGCGLGDETSL